MGDNKQAYFDLIVGDKSAKLSKPTRQVMKIALSKLQQGDSISAGEIIINSCWIDGDKELKDFISDENAELSISACLAANGVLNLRNTELKKL